MTTRHNAGKTWLREEYQALREGFAAGKDIAQLADAHGRTAGAILGKLLELRLIVEAPRGFYHRVDPDPWCSYHDVRIADGKE